ncbi:hypothetical protein BGZ76_007312 [Entomortierella beljakovae]|nr:hypothetical protein BGZ76_007312 [Entomortierella beljakovae]
MDCRVSIESNYSIDSSHLDHFNLKRIQEIPTQSIDGNTSPDHREAISNDCVEFLSVKESAKVGDEYGFFERNSESRLHNSHLTPAMKGSENSVVEMEGEHVITDSDDGSKQGSTMNSETVEMNTLPSPTHTSKNVSEVELKLTAIVTLLYAVSTPLPPSPTSETYSSETLLDDPLSYLQVLFQQTSNNDQPETLVPGIDIQQINPSTDSIQPQQEFMQESPLFEEDYNPIRNPELNEVTLVEDMNQNCNGSNSNEVVLEETISDIPVEQRSRSNSCKVDEGGEEKEHNTDIATENICHTQLELELGDINANNYTNDSKCTSTNETQNSQPQTHLDQTIIPSSSDNHVNDTVAGSIKSMEIDRNNIDSANHNVNNEEFDLESSNLDVEQSQTYSDDPITVGSSDNYIHKMLAESIKSIEIDHSNTPICTNYDSHNEPIVLESSSLDVIELPTVRFESASPDNSSSSSSPTSSASSTAPSPRLNPIKQRPYTQFQPKYLLEDLEDLDNLCDGDDVFQKGSFLKLRKSRSMPSTPCSPVILQSAAQQAMSGTTPFTFSRGRTESGKVILFDDLQEGGQEGKEEVESANNQRDALLASAPNSTQLLPSLIPSSTGISEELLTLTPSDPLLQLPTSERPRRQSLLSPRQLEMMSKQNEASEALGADSGAFGKRGGFSNFLKEHTRKNRNKNNNNNNNNSSNNGSIGSNTSDNSQKRKIPTPKKQRPTPSNTPAIFFHPHSTEISTDRPSVSGRLVLRIPRLAGHKFYFISLALHLRLKESISWTRQDLVTFETEKHNWSQIVWDKKMMLPYQDRQVEEGGEAGFTAGIGNNLSPAAAVAAAASASAFSENELRNLTQEQNRFSIVSSTSGRPMSMASGGFHFPSSSKFNELLAAPTVMDEWRWEWLLPVSKKEVRPESFEGSMGFVWYELEAKCLFRWDKVDSDGNVIKSEVLQVSNSPANTGGVSDTKSSTSRGLGAAKLLKGLGVFGKLRGGNKTKKAQASGDFTPNVKHDEFLKKSLVTSNSGGQTENLQTGVKNDHKNSNSKSKTRASAEPVPFLIRKTLKLYFNTPPPQSNPAFYMPTPSMSLPNLPSTRRLKAIIPGAKIQVQIQVPSVIHIPGYAQTSQLVPCPKTGNLIAVTKGEKSLYNLVGIKKSRSENQLEKKHPHNFQAALTIRKLTKQDIKGNDILRRRYENAQLAAEAVSNSLASQYQKGATSPKVSTRKRLLSFQSGVSQSTGWLGAINDSIFQSGVNMAEKNDSSNATNETTGVVEVQKQESRAWRKEIHVRKVNCEFWQKEICRIPLDDVPTRSTKTAIGPAFTFTEKEYERSRNINKHRPQQPSPMPDTNCSDTVDGSQLHQHPSLQLIAPSPRNNDGSRAGSPAIPVGNDNNGPLKPPPRFGSNSELACGVDRKASSGSTKSFAPMSQPNSMAHSQTSSNQPFTLLIPVPLDSPDLHQSYVWPSPEAPSPIAPPGVDYGNPRDSSIFGLESSGAGYGSELDYPSQFTVTETTSFDDEGKEIGKVNHITGANGNIYNNGPSNTTSAKARIEVQHYLAFRLSIDVLEFEGEYERDDYDETDGNVGTTEDCSNLVSSDDSACHGKSSHKPFTNNSSGCIASLANRSNMTSGPTSPTIEQRPGVGLNAATSSGLSGIEPALNFINSTAGLLDIGTNGESRTCTGQSLADSMFDLPKGNGSKASQSSYKVNDGNPSTVETATSATASSNSGGGTGGIFSGAIGAIKRKASGSALSAAHQQQQQQPHQHQRDGGNVKVQRLKDFVIRVPITVAIQLGENVQANREVMGGVRRGSNENNGEIKKESLSSATHMARRGDNNNGLQFQHESSRGNVTITATTTTTNILTGSSGPTFEETETFNSMNSMRASASSDHISKRIMDDFAPSSSSALMIARMKHRQNDGVQPSNNSPVSQGYQHPLQKSLPFHHDPSITKNVNSGDNYASDSVTLQVGGVEGKEVHDNKNEEVDFIVVDAEEMVEDETERELARGSKDLLKE